MELICIETSTPRDTRAIIVIKDSRYTLLKSEQKPWSTNRPGNIWYNLLETGETWHHSSLFAIAPDTEEVKKEEQSLENTLNAK